MKTSNPGRAKSAGHRLLPGWRSSRPAQRHAWLSGARRVASWPAGLALLAFAADAATKAWAQSALRGGHRVAFAGGLVRLQLVVNHGASFGIAARYEPLITVTSIAAVLALGLWAAKSSGTVRFGAALAAGGAAGNLADRLTGPAWPLRGGVTDWLHVAFYSPVFNLADLCLRGGLLIALGASLWRGRSLQPADARRARSS